MKNIVFVFALLFCAYKSESQLLKKIKTTIVSGASTAAEGKLYSESGKAVNKVLTPGKKTSPGKSNELPPENTTGSASADGSSKSNKTEAPAQQSSDGFLDVAISSKSIFIGGTLFFTGQSGVYEKVNSVEVVISSGHNPQNFTVPLDKSGKFNTGWTANGPTGNYTATVYSSDKKTSKVLSFTVGGLHDLDDMAGESISVTKKIVAQIEKRVAAAKAGLATKDAAALEKKSAEGKQQANTLIDAFEKINTAGKTFSAAAKQGEVLPVTLSHNLSVLKNELTSYNTSSQVLLDNIEHRTNPYTICETLVMVSEACAALSTATNFAAKGAGFLKNIFLDKVIPFTAAGMNDMAPNLTKMSGDKVALGVKYLSAAHLDLESLNTGMGKLGIAGDLAQYAANTLLKNYCGVFEGSVTHSYAVDFRNKDGITWWKYGYNTGAKIVLRYPKDNGNGKIVNMKGHIEGNATGFDFYQNIKAEDGFYETTKGHTIVKQLAVLTPFTIPVVSAEADRLGFGMMSRAVATPAYFCLPVDAIYDRNAQTIRIVMTEGGIDFTELVKHRVLFCVPVPLPLFRIQDFPIEKCKKTMDAVIRRYGEYKVVETKGGGLSFAGSSVHHAGGKGSEIETTVNLSINAKQE
ncbi:hypothetical protein [Ferruginibacter profundus]